MLAGTFPPQQRHDWARTQFPLTFSAASIIYLSLSTLCAHRLVWEQVTGSRTCIMKGLTMLTGSGKDGAKLWNRPKRVCGGFLLARKKGISLWNKFYFFNLPHMKVYKRTIFPTWVLIGLKRSSCLENHQLQEIWHLRGQVPLWGVTKWNRPLGWKETIFINVWKQF